ncbi:odorant receptor 13a-like [Aphidius gifuensis]|uniref:odorant receptor 13a-like n=1 Tax=Aphidius gifuensis TaxID=684658 RepID=UPI001CDB548F|nr:odorant receptor 13a-like [Aphidius gifuensis]
MRTSYSNAAVHRRIADASILGMKFSGFWNFSNNPNTIEKLFNLIYKLMMKLIIYTFATTLVADLISNTDDLKIFIDDGCFFAGIFVIIFKLTTFGIYENNINELIEKIFKPIDYLKNLNDKDVTTLINENIFFERCTAYGFASLAVCLLITMIFFGNHKDGELPIRAKYPFNSTEGINYTTAFTIQATGVTMGLAGIMAMDTIVLGLCRWTKFQFDVLYSNFQHCGDDIANSKKQQQKKLINNDKTGHNNSEIFKNFVAFNSNENHHLGFSERFKICIKNHQRLIGIIESVNNLFGLNMFVQICGSSFIICFAGYQALLGSNGMGDLMKFSCYCGTGFSQLFIWSYFGNNLLCQGDLLSDGQWFSGWEKQNSRDLKNLLTIPMIRTRKPLELKAMNFFTMSIETFMMILRASYSIFTLLRTMEMK